MSNTPQTSKSPAFFVLEQQGYELPKPVERTYGGTDKYVTYGTDNGYPAFLWRLYEETAIFQTLVNNLCDYICGEAVNFAKPATFDMSREDMEALVRKAALDLIITGACSVQRIRNKAGMLVKLAYLDQVKVRYNETVDKRYYCNRWATKDKIVTLPLNDSEAETDAVTLRSVCKGIYPTPLYNGALKSIVIANKIDTYHLNNISNNFAAATLINFNNGVPDNATKDKVETDLRNKFCGEENAGKFVVSWNESKENEATIAPLSSNDFDAKYNALRRNYEQNIVVAFRCPAQLLGYSTSTTTFNTVEYVAAFDLYNRTMVKPMQRQIVAFLNKAMGGEYLSIEPYIVTLQNANDYDSNKNI